MSALLISPRRPTFCCFKTVQPLHYPSVGSEPKALVPPASEEPRSNCTILFLSSQERVRSKAPPIAASSAGFMRLGLSKGFQDHVRIVLFISVGISHYIISFLQFHIYMRSGVKIKCPVRAPGIIRINLLIFHFENRLGFSMFGLTVGLICHV